MQRWRLRSALSVLVTVVAVALFFILRHHLLMPTTAQLADAFPGNTQQVLEQSDQLILLSLEPRPLTDKDLTRPNFHGYPILGQTQISDADQRQQLLLALYDGIARSNQALPTCFSPRHGIRAVRGHTTVDLVICFHCRQFFIYSGATDKLAGIADTPQPMFDRVLSQAGVPLVQQ